ncbi:hypothetical protein TrRE_jg3170 [Triparma retinervis]|uniref:Uncharacterized protein n=1 Tax=Triparma retinervis TaxID=2557542 RepID=A0A9W7EDR4_9STRA|nr:hypothetical protein TrRE_jg3170 [Triparma retinervis]
MSEDLATSKAELADVLELLADSPDDPDLLQLKSDLEELIALAEGGDGDEEEDDAADIDDLNDDGAIDDNIIGITLGGPPAPSFENNDDGPSAGLGVPPSPLSTPSVDVEASNVKKSKPTITSSSEFKIPDNLKLQSTDTEEEKLKKRKKVKRLKQKFNGAKSEAVSTEKAASWKSFVKGGKKSKKRKGVGKDSQFKTKDDGKGEGGASGKAARQKFTY